MDLMDKSPVSEKLIACQKGAVAIFNPIYVISILFN